MLPILALVLSAAAPQAGETKDAIAFLQTHQTAAGGFVTKLPTKGQEPVPSLRTTRTAIRAHRLLGEKPPNPEKVIQFLIACYDEKSGGFGDRPGVVPDSVSTAVALMILLELKQPTDKYLERALAFMGEHATGFEQIRMVASGLEETGKTVPQSTGWVNEIKKLRNKDGTFGNGPGQARTTALNVVTLQRLGEKVADPNAILKVLRAGQREDGGFGSDAGGGSDLEACYRIVRLFSRLNAKPDHPDKLEQFITKCKNKDGGYGVKPGSESSLHGTYYAAILRHWLADGK